MKRKSSIPIYLQTETNRIRLKGWELRCLSLLNQISLVEWAPNPESSTEENIVTLKRYIKDEEAQLVTPFNHDELITEILLKNGFTLNFKIEKLPELKKNDIFLATDGEKETLICLDIIIDMETVEYFKKNIEKKFICLERSLDTTKKWNLIHYLSDKFKAF